MPDGREAITVRVISRIADVDPSQWDACAGRRSPFVGHAFLSALEDSRSAVRETGWLPQHLVIPAPDGGILGAVPLYMKTHSYGEYIFDWGWANAYERAGGAYYPKLQCCVPFTPATGPRFLVRPDADQELITGTLIGALKELSREADVVTLHVTFAERDEWLRLGEAGFLTRTAVQYHWTNPGYQSFDEFLATLTSRKRKMIRKERQKVRESGIELKCLRGSEISAYHWNMFYQFYLSTIDKKWASAYLTREFFHLLGERLTDRVMLVIAEDGGHMVAGALNLIGEDALYGRYWGCSSDYRFLHFEACYYQAMDFAIANSIARVEAGAQGEHKIQRGYLPCHVYSAHWIRDAGLHAAIEDFLRRESQGVDHEIAALGELSPFRACGTGGPAQSGPNHSGK